MLPFDASKEVEQMFPKMRQWRRQIHMNPELGFEEVKTSKMVAEHLESLGIEVQTGVAKTGVVGLLRGDKADDSSKVLLIRADMDALPIEEENEVEYKSKNKGVMHACGHDSHVATLMALAELLAGKKSELAGTVKFVFQPAEEGPGGAKPMIEAGVLENPKVDAALALHVWNEFPLGVVGVRSGPILASADTFKFKIIGKGGHGAVPHHSIDSIVIASQAILAMQTIVSRRIDPQMPAVVSVGTIKGGFRSNVIAPDVECTGTFRTFDEEMRGQISDMIEQTLKATVSMHGADYEYKRIPNYPPTVNDEQMSSLVRKAALNVLDEDKVINPNPSMGAEDMSYFLQKVPGCFFLVGSAPSDGAFPHHHPRFDIAEEAMAVGLAVMLESVKLFFES